MFTFRLQPVLDFRKREEEQKQRELAVINLELSTVRESLDALVAGREENAKQLTLLARTAHDVREMKLFEDFLEGRDQDIAWKRKELQSVTEKVRQKQIELQEYMKRRRVLELYRDRLKEAYEREERRRERLFLDETAAQMWFREEQWHNA